MRVRLLWYIGALLLYLGLASYNLGLPGLHYDEAKEAGVNAVELLSGQPVTAFRDASLSVAGISLPLMVQDYIGAINVYLSLPILKLTGIGVPNLRFLSVLLGLAALVTLERAISSWVVLHSERSVPRVPLTLASLITVTLLAASPSFVFWSRQGIFVTNVIQPLCFGFIWMGLTWLRTERRRYLLISGLLAGLALYGKLLAIWVVAPFVLYFTLNSWGQTRGRSIKWFRNWLLFGIMALLPLTPFFLFNWQSQGTVTALFANAAESYYGVDNSAFRANFLVRWSQVLDVLRGNQFWYLGGIVANAAAPWFALAAAITGLLFKPRQTIHWVILIGGGFALSLFTISDLFITHYALLHPLIVALVGLGLASAAEPIVKTSRRLARSHKIRLNQINERQHTPMRSRENVLRVAIASTLVIVWLGLDIRASVGYHTALEQSGGLADHSDASYKLAYHLRFNGMGAPILLDWGMDAPIRFLSEGTVRPIEIFGYESPARPDLDFGNRVGQFLDNPNNVYLLHSPGTTVFAGRREAFLIEVEARQLSTTLEETFLQRDGTPLFELWRVK